jgi:hypothetical protein
LETGRNGEENGKEMFDRLEAEVAAYNERWGGLGGKVVLQPYKIEAESCDNESDSDTDIKQDERSSKPPPRKKRKANIVKQPMVLALCTPLMSRAHEMVQQAGELVFCDSTSTLDRFGNSMFVLSTSYAACSVPLGVVVVLDEKQSAIQCGLKKLQEVLPNRAFYGRGAFEGPSLVMTDDSTPEREALHSTWNKTRLLLCIFHFLQRRWTWMHDSKNRIGHRDRITLINVVKSMVYSKSEIELNTIYSQLKSHEVAKKYPQFVQHIQSLWSRRKEWAMCFRHDILIQGNNTNNYAEAGIRIIKDQVFSRIKAYNLVQMFSFITKSMEIYYQRKLLNVSNNRLDNFVAEKFLGKGASTVQQGLIESLGNGMYRVQSRHRLKGGEEKYHMVDMHIGACSCEKGKDGSPCAHQSAVVAKYKIQSVNCFPSLSTHARQVVAKLAIGDKAKVEIDFYASIHQEKYDQDGKVMETYDTTSMASEVGMIMEKLRQNKADDDDDDDDNVMDAVHTSDSRRVTRLKERLGAVMEDIEQKLETDNYFRDGVEKFLNRYESMQGRKSLTQDVHVSCICN